MSPSRPVAAASAARTSDSTQILPLSLSAWQVRVPGAGRRHDADAAAEVHPGGDGQGADGEEPVQGAADGAAGGGSVD